MQEQTRTVSLELRPDLAAPRAARGAIQHLLVELPDQFVADAVLLTSELVTNAVLHTAADFSVSAEFDPTMRCLRVEVADASSEVSAVTTVDPPGKSSLGGHGLRIVAAIARRWGVSSTDGGKVVWFELGV